MPLITMKDAKAAYKQSHHLQRVIDQIWETLSEDQRKTLRETRDLLFDIGDLPYGANRRVAEDLAVIARKIGVLEDDDRA